MPFQHSLLTESGSGYINVRIIDFRIKNIVKDKAHSIKRGDSSRGHNNPKPNNRCSIYMRQNQQKCSKKYANPQL